MINNNFDFIKFCRLYKYTSKGMSLIEILIVISLIAIVMSILATQLTKQQDEAMIDATKLSMGKIQQSLQLFRLHNNYLYPTTDQGLSALVTDPGNTKKWRGPYIEEEKLKDPWGNEFQYESDGRTFKIISSGPDKDFGTEDDIIFPEDTKNED